MKRHYLVLALLALGLNTAEAVVGVNGISGEDNDGLSPFETLQAAIDYANTGSENVIEIQTNSSIPGAAIQSVPLNHDLTIKAGNGFNPVLSSPVYLVPSNADWQITLQDITVSTDGTATPLSVGCNLTAVNCVFDGNPIGGGNYLPAVTASTPSLESTGTLTLTSCTLQGFTGLEAGRAIRDYIIDRTYIEANATDLDNSFSGGITNTMNWISGYWARLSAGDGFVEISEPRTLMITNSYIKAGLPLGWPMNTLGNPFYENENSTIGPVNATNTIFEGFPYNGIAHPIQINNTVVPPNQHPDSTFRHCTFRTIQAFGLFWFRGGQAATHTFQNCLFDAPLSNYAIFSGQPSITFTGDANTYNVYGGYEMLPTGVPFEATEHNYMAVQFTDPLLTDATGHLIGHPSSVVGKALAASPSVLTDMDNNPRPMPASAARSDIGADEIDETDTSVVKDWSVY